MGEAVRHPVGLRVLYLTEVWERFSFYGLRSLLVLYLNAGVLEPGRFGDVIGSRLVMAFFSVPVDSAGVQALSSQINEAYSGIAYLTPLAGGVIADRLLGTRVTLLLGGVLMAMGHACMAFEQTFLIGLLLLVLGNGGFKPTISAILSRLYEPPGLSALRDRGELTPHSPLKFL
jgi:POT family proton-dependent oligopeptide transporter